MLRRLARLRPTTEARSLSCLCDHCPLAGQRPVPPLPSRSKLLILADSPGLDEDYAGYPFAGNVERFLRSTLKGLGLDLSTIHQTTAVLCLPKKKMRPAEWQRAIECCKPRLMAEIGSPRTVLAAGVHALSALTGLGKLTPWIGGPQVLASGTTVIPAPAFGVAIRNPAMLPVLKTFLARAAIGDLSWDWGQLVTVGPYAPHLERLMTEEEISVDIENSPASGRIRCIGVGSATLAVSVPLPPEGDATPEDLLMLRRLLASPIRKVLQNGQHDRTELKHHGWELNGPFFDTLLTHAVVAPRLPHDLGFMCAVEFAAPRWKTEFHVESDDKKSVRFDKAKLDELLTYNAKDNIMQARLAHRLRGRLATVHNGDVLLAELEYLDNLTLQMREKGVAVNKAALDRHRTGLTVELERINKSFEDVLGAHSTTYKLGKNGQHRSLNKLFFDHFGAPPMEYSEETGAPSLNNKTLTYYIKKYTEEGSPIIAQIARLILEYREQAKLLGSYINNLPAVGEDGLLVVHPTWRTFGTRTGRWSAVDPAVQTLPKRLRDIFCARPGMAMVEADYSQLELRIVALLSGDRKLLDWYEAGLDVHAQNASEIFGTTWIDADPKKRDGLRKLAKNVVYGMNYGGSAKTIWGMLLVKTPGIQLAAIEFIVRRWFELHPEIKRWQDSTIANAQERCYVEAPLSGRRQYYNDGVVVPTEVLNFPIQGTAGDLANMAIRRVYESGILPLAQIHDAVLAEGTDGLALARKLKAAMELEVTLNGAKTRFPCDVKMGPSWLDMREVKL